MHARSQAVSKDGRDVGLVDVALHMLTDRGVVIVHVDREAFEDASEMRSFSRWLISVSARLENSSEFM